MAVIKCGEFLHQLPNYYHFGDEETARQHTRMVHVFNDHPVPRDAAEASLEEEAARVAPVI
jgi:hypothetical protein